MRNYIYEMARHLPAPIKVLIHESWKLSYLCLTRGQITAPDGETFHVPYGLHRFDFHSLRQGQYEAPEIGVMRKFFQPEKGTIIEVGANIGVVARYAISEKLLPGGSYIALEPNPSAFGALKLNLDNTQRMFPDRTIHLVTQAIDAPSKNGTQALFYSRRSLGSGLAHLATRRKHENEIYVPITSLSRIVEDCAEGPISLICDAEGAEIPIIMNDRAGLSRVHQIAVELHDTSITGSQVTPAMMREALTRQGFKCYGSISHTYYFRREPA